MKFKILLLLTLATSAFAATDRLELRRSETLADRQRDRVELARSNADFTPSMPEECSRSLMVADDRNSRNRLYLGETRFDARILAVLESQSDAPVLSIKETKALIWTEACAETPALINAKLLADPATDIWYDFKNLDAVQNNSDYADALDTIKKYFK